MSIVVEGDTNTYSLRCVELNVCIYIMDRHGNFSLKSVNVTRIREKARWRNRVLSRADASFTAHSPANRPPISAAKVGLKCNFRCSTGSPCVGVSCVQVPRCWSLFFSFTVERSLFPSRRNVTFVSSLLSWSREHSSERKPAKTFGYFVAFVHEQ